MKNKSEIVVKSEEKYDIGDMVELIISPATRILSALLVFIIPVVFMVLFYCISFFWFRFNEGVSVLISFFGCAVSYCILKLCDSKYGKKFEVRIRKCGA